MLSERTLFSVKNLIRLFLRIRFLTCAIPWIHERHLYLVRGK